MSDDKTVVSLHRTPVQHDIVAGLRKLADRLEAGGPAEVDMDAVTTVVCVLGHSTDRHLPNGEVERGCQHEMFSWGPRCDALTTRGLLATALKWR